MTLEVHPPSPPNDTFNLAAHHALDALLGSPMRAALVVCASKSTNTGPPPLARSLGEDLRRRQGDEPAWNVLEDPELLRRQCMLLGRFGVFNTVGVDRDRRRYQLDPQRRALLLGMSVALLEVSLDHPNRMPFTAFGTKPSFLEDRPGFPSTVASIYHAILTNPKGSLSMTELNTASIRPDWGALDRMINVLEQDLGTITKTSKRRYEDRIVEVLDVKTAKRSPRRPEVVAALLQVGAQLLQERNTQLTMQDIAARVRAAYPGKHSDEDVYKALTHSHIRMFGLPDRKQRGERMGTTCSITDTVKPMISELDKRLVSLATKPEYQTELADRANDVLTPSALRTLLGTERAAYEARLGRPAK